MQDAVVVGAGPNGLAAAVAIAMAGFEVTVLEARDTIGGGTRTSTDALPGLVVDECSAVHPLGVASPFLTSLPLADHGLQWAWPEVGLAHPLDGGDAAVLHRSLDTTVAALGDDGERWRRRFAPLVTHHEAFLDEVLRPPLHVPRAPVTLGRFGVAALRSAEGLVSRWTTDAARALFAGVAAHAMQPLDQPLTGAVGLVLAAAGHAGGWPVAVGGSAAVTSALASLFRNLGGTIHTGVTLRRLADLPRSRVALFDTTPGALVTIAGDAMPARVRRSFARYRHGPAAFKVDLAVAGGVPWTAEACRRAGTVHVGGTLEEIAAAERDAHAGRMPDRPFVLVAQQYLADPARSNGEVHPVWAYAHVPHGWAGDATDALIDQVERFAPGLRERIVGVHVRTPADLERDNANHVGGDISAGANSPGQVLFRPRMAMDPYTTGIPGVFLCSAATPPGAGVHGMCGANAAASALRVLRR